jgi:hypothetical protein
MTRYQFPLILLFAGFLSSCASLNQPWQAGPMMNEASPSKLQTGDIIITSKDWKNPISWFGHSAVMVNRDTVGEYPKLYYGYYETEIGLWLSHKKEFTVLRYKNFDADFRRVFLQNLQNARHKTYQIVSKTNGENFYCSQYIWYLYWKTARDLGYELDVDKNGGFLVTPYDLLNSNYFYTVLF